MVSAHLRRVCCLCVEYLLKWVGWPESANSWEPASHVSGCAKLIAAYERAHPRNSAPNSDLHPLKHLPFCPLALASAAASSSSSGSTSTTAADASCSSASSSAAAASAASSAASVTTACNCAELTADSENEAETSDSEHEEKGKKKKKGSGKARKAQASNAKRPELPPDPPLHLLPPPPLPCTAPPPLLPAALKEKWVKSVCKRYALDQKALQPAPEVELPPDMPKVSCKPSAVPALLYCAAGFCSILCGGCVIVAQTFRLALILGASGVGKTTLLRRFGAAHTPQWDPNRSVISHFASYEEGERALSGVGFSSLPGWTKPYHVLSMGACVFVCEACSMQTPIWTEPVLC